MSRVMATLVGILTGIGEFAYSLLWGRRQARFIQNLLVDTDHLPNRRVIVSLSTLPERISNLEPTLRCLLEQTRPPDEIVLAVPEFSIRQQKKYIVPGYLEKNSPSPNFALQNGLGTSDEIHSQLFKRSWPPVAVTH